MGVSVSEQLFGTFEGATVHKFTISQENGISVSAINYGATITNIFTPDKHGVYSDVVLGFETLDGYLNAGNIYMGSICGRFANRIANGQFKIDGIKYTLPKNNGANNLHGGFKGFDKVYWTAEVLPENNGVRFTYKSKDGEEGFPGNLLAYVTYRVINNALEIEYKATTDKPTPVNLTNHCYFNLSGGMEKDIKNHHLQLNADSFLEVTEDAIPTGVLKKVKNSAMDFTTLNNIGSVIDKVDGYDHCWAINKKNDTLVKAASLVHNESGRKMTVHTTKPGIQFYSGNFLNGSFISTKNGATYKKHAGLCLETQYFPDSPNQRNFPNTILNIGEEYHHKTIYTFTI